MCVVCVCFGVVVLNFEYNNRILWCSVSVLHCSCSTLLFYTYIISYRILSKNVLCCVVVLWLCCGGLRCDNVL